MVCVCVCMCVCACVRACVCVCARGMCVCVVNTAVGLQQSAGPLLGALLRLTLLWSDRTLPSHWPDDWRLIFIEC